VRGPVPASAPTGEPRRTPFDVLSRLLLLTVLGCAFRGLLLLVPAGHTPAPPRAVGDFPPAAVPPVVTAEIAAAVAPAAGPPAADRPPLDPKALAEVADELKAKRARLDQRERDLDQREAALRQVQDGIAAQIAQLEGLKRELDGLLAKASAEENERVDRLVKVYEAMKPAKAAEIFNATETGLLLPVVKRMREAKVAAIVEEMEPAKAQALTLDLAKGKELPQVPPPPGRPSP
jgi:flagellar motility protein MotE (MotC chaperone)